MSKEKERPLTMREVLFLARRAAGLTQAYMAKKLGCAQSDYSKWETGKLNFEAICRGQDSGPVLDEIIQIIDKAMESKALTGSGSMKSFVEAIAKREESKRMARAKTVPLSSLLQAGPSSLQAGPKDPYVEQLEKLNAASEKVIASGQEVIAFYKKENAHLGRLNEINAELVEAYKELVAEQKQEYTAKIMDLEKRIADLRDLLGLETKAALVRSTIEEPVAETVPPDPKPKLTVKGMQRENRRLDESKE